MNRISKEIFRAYDIRGIVGSEINDDLSYNIGRAFGTYLIRQNRKRVSVSGDVRPSTLTLKNKLIDGLKDSGIEVLDIGTLPTPMNYFSMYIDHLNLDAAIQITGSHNPSEYNGFKMTYDKKPFYGDKIQMLYNMIIEKDFIDQIGTYESIDISEFYINMIQSKINIKSKIKVAIDCGNAAGCIIAPLLYKKFNLDVHELFCDIDGTFPNHHPDPTVDSNLSDLQSFVTTNNCDVGIAFDGDADRIVVIDEKGTIIRSDILIALFLPHVIKEGDSVVYDVKCSKALEDMILSCKGNPVMWKTGHSLIKDKMKNENAKLGGEMSGHIFFSDDYFGYDDAVYVGLRLLEILSKFDRPMSSYLENIPIYYSTPEIRLNCVNDNEKINIMNEAFDYFSNKFEYSDIDGIRLKLENGWALIRCSNTQPVIVCRVEASSDKKLDSYKSMVIDKLISLGVSYDE